MVAQCDLIKIWSFTEGDRSEIVTGSYGSCTLLFSHFSPHHFNECFMLSFLAAQLSQLLLLNTRAAFHDLYLSRLT